MPVEAVALSAVASASNAFISLWKYGLHYVEIPGEVEQFRVAINNLETSLNTAKRIRRVRSYYLDEVTKAEVDGTIERSESCLESISRTIEKCRADLQTKGTVSAKNRLDWIFSGHDQFMARSVALSSCLQLLNSQVHRMDAMQPPIRTGERDPPSYTDSLSPEQRLRAPSVRKRSSRLANKGSFSNLSTFSFSSDKEMIESSQDAGTRGIHSDEDSVVSARLSSVPDLSCPGDYCTNELCVNHARTTTSSLDSGFQQRKPPTITVSSTADLPPDLLPRLTQKRRNRSGLI